MTNLNSKYDLSVVIPVYQAEASLEELIQRLDRVLTATANRFEVILVNDGSSDRSWAIIETLAAKHAWIRGVNLMRNYGQHNALLCGIRLAKHDVVITLDDDLQNPPEEIPKLIEIYAQGYDVVYGTPMHERHGFLRDVASVITKLALQSVTGVAVARSVSTFRAFRTSLREAFADYRGPFVSIDVLLAWGASRYGAVQVSHEKRSLGASNYTFGKLLRHAVNMMTGFSVLPLQVASFTGFALTAFGGVVLVYVLGRWLLYGSVVQGFAFLASIIAIFSGAQLFALGIIGEYLARMHFRMMDRPSYTIKEMSGIDE